MDRMSNCLHQGSEGAIFWHVTRDVEVFGSKSCCHWCPCGFCHCCGGSWAGLVRRPQPPTGASEVPKPRAMAMRCPACLAVQKATSCTSCRHPARSAPWHNPTSSRGASRGPPRRADGPQPNLALRLYKRRWQLLLYSCYLFIHT